MKKIVICFSFFVVNNLFAQNFFIKYERIRYEEFDNGTNKICPTLLYTNSEESYFLEDRVINDYSTEVLLSNYRQNDTIGNRIKGDSLGQIIYKNLKYNSFKQRRRVSGYNKETYGIMIDTIIPNFNWKLENEYKEILGYKTQKASTKYLGRDIIAWFTNSILINNGPWKFSNLPGLILKIEISLTTESYLVYEAVSIKSIEKMPIFNFYNSSEFTLKEIENFYKKKYENQYKYFKTKTNGSVKLRKDDLDFEPIIFESN